VVTLILINFAFLEKKYSKAIELYSRAIQLDSQVAAYYSNRAFAYMKEEYYGAALADATRALEIDSNYVKVGK
jgi:serine/threonine-protein phosphatase 5